MTETPGTYDVARCHCDADWRIEQWVSADVLIVCKQCGELIMDFEAVARWNKQRAEIERLRAENKLLNAEANVIRMISDAELGQMLHDYEAEIAQLMADDHWQADKRAELQAELERLRSELA
jgi:environmental stress-induced protein Ves